MEPTQASSAARDPHPPQDEATKSGGVTPPPKPEEFAAQAQRGPRPPQDQA
jgi:hypothetical protein